MAGVQHDGHAGNTACRRGPRIAREEYGAEAMSTETRTVPERTSAGNAVQSVRMPRMLVGGVSVRNASPLFARIRVRVSAAMPSSRTSALRPDPLNHVVAAVFGPIRAGAGTRQQGVG